MTREMIPYLAIGYVSVLVSAISQVMLKKASMRIYTRVIFEYFNPRVVVAYFFFFVSTLLTMTAYKGVPLSMAPIFDCGSYIFIIAFGKLFFDEKITRRKLLAMSVLFLGIVVYAL